MPENCSRVLTKVDFAPLIDEIVQKKATMDTIMNGFKTCELSRLNPNAIDYKKGLEKSDFAHAVITALDVNADITALAVNADITAAEISTDVTAVEVNTDITAA